MAEPRPEPPVEFHYIITAQRPSPRGGLAVDTLAGTVTFKPGITRAQAFVFLFDDFKNKKGWASDEGNILLFDLAPNTLI